MDCSQSGSDLDVIAQDDKIVEGMDQFLEAVHFGRCSHAWSNCVLVVKRLYGLQQLVD
jgi:hypothetical protein